MRTKIKLPYFKDSVQDAAIFLSSQIIHWIKNANAKGGVIGISGGVDSSTLAYLCKFALDNSKDKQLKLLGVMMPSLANSTKDVLYATEIINNLKIPLMVVDIEPIAKKFMDNMPKVLNTEYDIGNLYSEIRAIVLSRIAANNNYLIMGTGNKDEDYVLGYFTKRGDGAVDNNILGNLSKRLVRELATYLGVPEKIINRVPTAGLWENQTDENEIGYTYSDAELIYNGIEQGINAGDIIKEVGCERWVLANVSLRHNLTEHKRQLLPVGNVNLLYK